jgi:hypothetical protein
MGITLLCNFKYQAEKDVPKQTFQIYWTMYNEEVLIKMLFEEQWEIKSDLVQACRNEIINK